METWILAAGIATAAIGIVMLARAGEFWETFDLEHMVHNPKAPIAYALVAIGAVLIGGWFVLRTPGPPVSQQVKRDHVGQSLEFTVGQ